MGAGLSMVAFVWTFLIVMGITIMWGLLIISRKDIDGRLNKYFNKESPEEPEEKKKDSITKKLGHSFAAIESLHIGKVLAVHLQKAGIYLKVSEFAAIAFIFILTGVIMGNLIGGGMIISVAFGLFGGYMPFIYIKILQKKRLNTINSQIVDAFSFISNSLKAGHSFFQAMDHASREIPPPIAHEFERVVKETNLGATTENALMELGQRVESDDLDLVITAVLIQREIGGNLSEILDNISNTIRERVRIKGEIKALTAQGRISGILIALLPVILLIFLSAINPEYASALFTHPLGRLLLIGSVFGEILGALLISKIVNIRV